MIESEIRVEIELTTQSAFLCDGQPQSPTVYRKKDTKRMKLKTEYDLAYGACLRIDDVFANGCTYEEYACEMNPSYCTHAKDFPRKVGFSKWNERISIYVPYPPTDVLCCLYVTFIMSESEKQSLPGMELLLPEKKSLPREDGKWICPTCGATNTISVFCSNCGKGRERKVVAKSNICYFDANGEVCEKENAVTCIITEYDEDGKLLNSVHGYINGSQNLNGNIIEEPDDDETMWLCPLCGAFNRFENKYCVKCGYYPR